jgi:hypothetical protein
MPHAVTIAATSAALNQHQVQFAAETRQRFRVGLEFESELPWATADEVYSAKNVSIGSVVQPYQPRFTPTNAETWDAVDLSLKPVKIDLEFTEEQLVKFYEKWLNEWFEGGKPAAEWSYPRFITEEVIIPQAQEDLNSISWAGVFAAPTLGTAGAMLDSCTGFAKRIVDAITAGALTPVATGAYTSSNIREKLEDWMKAMPIAVRGLPGTVYMSDTNARNYYFDFRGDFQTATWDGLQKNGGLMVDGFPVKVKGIKAMGASNRWIFVPDSQQNMVCVSRRGYPRDPQFIFDYNLYSVQVKAVIYRAYGFEYWQNVFVNDQA